MNGICAGGTGSFIDQMASLLQTDASGLNEYAKNYHLLYTIAARCGVFAKSDIQPLINDGAAKEDLGRSQPDYQRTCLRKANQRTCGIFRRAPAFPFRIKSGFHPYLKTG